MQSQTINPATITIPKTMKAVAISRFGGPEVMAIQELPLPRIDADEILLQVTIAGVGVWDPEERDGTLFNILNVQPTFPYVLGADGAGTVVAVGGKVSRFKPGDSAYAMSFMSPKGGFYAQYTAVKADNASPIPTHLTIEQAGVMPVDAITALRGLDDTLGLKRGESVLIFGASGGIGHLAVQLAKRLGARVLAVASGPDGVALVQRLGADLSIDGRVDDVAAAVRQFAPNGLDAALVTVNGRGLQQACAALRDDGRIAHPNGVEPPKARPGIRVQAYDGMPDPAAIEKLNRLINAGPFEVHIAQTFSLNQAADAHRALERHHLGKLALRPTP